MRWFGALFAAVAVLGCEAKDRDVALSQGQQALDQAKAAVGPAVDTLAKNVQSAYDSGSKDAMVEARKHAEALKDRIAAMNAPDSEARKRLQSVEDQIARLDASIEVQEIKKRLADSVETASQAKDAAGKKLDDIKHDLETTNAEYQSLQAKLAKAQKAYDTATAKVKQAVGN